MKKPISQDSSFTKKWRTRWDLTQTQAGDALGLRQRTIRKYEALGEPLIAKLAMKYLSWKWSK